MRASAYIFNQITDDCLNISQINHFGHNISFSVDSSILELILLEHSLLLTINQPAFLLAVVALRFVPTDKLTNQMELPNNSDFDFVLMKLNHIVKSSEHEQWTWF